MNKLFRPFVFVWQAFTEVPGWPDAPLRLRWLRSLPVTLPCVLLLALGVWMWLIQAPVENATRQSFASVVDLENEVVNLRLAYSDQRAVEIARDAANARTSVVASDEELAGVIAALHVETDALWTTKVAVGEPSDPSGPDARFRHQLLRVNLSPNKDNTRPLVALLALLERLSTFHKRIELTRLAIRADDLGWHSVDIALAVPRSLSYEKTP